MSAAWNEADAVKWWTAGLSAQQIANRLGMTRNAVCGRLFRMGLRRGGGCVVGVRPPAAPRAAKPVRVVVAKPIRMAPTPCPTLVMVHSEKPRPFLSRSRGECAWVLDDGSSCCNPSVAGVSYCAGHRAVVYRPTTRPDQFERTLRRYI